MNIPNRAEIGSRLNPLKKLLFWKKFSRFLLISLSMLVLLAGSQQVQLSKVFATSIGECVNDRTFLGGDEGDDANWVPGCDSGSGSGGQGGQGGQPAVSCPDDLRYCDTNINKTVYKHGGYWDGTQCVYAFDQEGACNVPAPVSCPDDLRYCDTNVNKIVHKFGGVPDASQPGGCRYAFEQEAACNVPAPATVTLCTGESKTWDEIDRLLLGANYPGPFY